MEQEEIKNLSQKLLDKNDLLALLNEIKQCEMKSAGLEDKFYPFTIRHINYYCNPNNNFHRFKEFKIRKKSGGVRQITAPKYKSYKALLSCINVLLKTLYIPSEYANGFTEGRSVITNSDKHKGQNYIYNIDLKDFFPSVDQARVWKRLQLTPFHFNQNIASIIAGICAMKLEHEDEKGNKSPRYVLPQGSPTSPIITNMICDKLDRRLAGLAKRLGLIYTRYADDITFSSMHNVYQKDGIFIAELNRIITDQGFKINEAKTRLQKKGARQEVTGIIVSDKLNVTQKYVRDIRNILYIWDRYGYNIAYSKFFPKYKSEKGNVKKGDPDMTSVLEGKLLYLKMVKGEEDSVYQRLNSKFQYLSNKPTNKAESNECVIYLDTVSVLEFEKLNKTIVDLYFDDLKKQRAVFQQIWFNRKNKYLTVSKDVNFNVDTKDVLSVSTCKNAKGEIFQLLHKTDKFTPKEPEKINLDDLINDLDSLICL